jgi:hypothetical protein
VNKTSKATGVMVHTCYPSTPTLKQEAKNYEFEASLGYIARDLKKNKQTRQARLIHY